MEAVLDGATMAQVLRDEGRAERMAEVLKALGHPIRLRLVAILAHVGERTVGDLARDLGLAQAIVSQQLAILRLQGLVRVRTSGGYRYYGLAVNEVVTLLQCMSRCHLLRQG